MPRSGICRTLLTGRAKYGVELGQGAARSRQLVWNTDVAGRAWVWDQMRADQLAVVSYTTSEAEMVDLGE
jgi:hypothetical protein